MLVINVYLLKYLCEFLDGKPLCGHGGVISVVGIVYCVQPVISGWHLRARRNYPYPLSGFIKPCARRLYVLRAELLAVAGKRVAVGYKVNLQQFCISLFPGHALGNVTAVCGRGALRNAVRLKRYVHSSAGRICRSKYRRFLSRDFLLAGIGGKSHVGIVIPHHRIRSDIAVFRVKLRAILLSADVEVLAYLAAQGKMIAV